MFPALTHRPKGRRHESRFVVQENRTKGDQVVFVKTDPGSVDCHVSFHIGTANLLMNRTLFVRPPYQDQQVTLAIAFVNQIPRVGDMFRSKGIL